MASVFKRAGSPYWYFQFVDYAGQRSVPKSTRTVDKQAAQRIANKHESDAALRREGVIDAAAERIIKQSNRSLQQHRIEFRRSLETSGKSTKHVEATEAAIIAAADLNNWQTLGDLTAEGLELYASELRKSGAANRTIQRKLAAVKQFAKWCTQTGRLQSNSLAYVKTPSPNVDRKLQRRALHPQEWSFLRSATTDAPPHTTGITGPQRATLYELAIQTGLRSAELRSLTPGKLHLDQSPPFVLVPSRSTKNKKPARQYVTADLAARLAIHVKSQIPGMSLFDLPHETGMAEMLRVDLAIARQRWINSQPKRKREHAEKSDFLVPTNHEGQELDFHSLRHTCGAWLAMAGENPKTIQTIMRHSSITLTMDTYGHLFPASESDAIARLGKSHFGD